MIFRAPSSKRAQYVHLFQPFLQPGKAENETNGQKTVAIVSNQTYFPVTNDLAYYRHLPRKKLGVFVEHHLQKQPILAKYSAHFATR